MSTPPEELDTSRAPLMDHLVELRKRLIWSFVTLAVTFGIAINFSTDILTFLVQPLKAAGQERLIYTSIFEGFFTQVKIAFFAALMVSFPVIATQIWLFIAPGLYANEKKAFLPFLLATPVLFIGGAAMAFYVAMPIALHYLLGFGGDLGGVQQEALPGVGNYLDFVTHFMFGFGVAFLLPVALMLVERVGLISLAKLRKGRRYAIVIAFIIAAVLTPPDVISQLLLAVPLMLLYEIALVGIWLTHRRRARLPVKAG